MHGRLFLKPHSDMTRLEAIFQEHEVRRVLDLGCGSGRHPVYLSRKESDTYGIDSSSTAISMGGFENLAAFH